MERMTPMTGVADREQREALEQVQMELREARATQPVPGLGPVPVAPMKELEDALQRARTELAQTKAAIKAARGEMLDALAAQLAAVQAQTAELDAAAEALEAELRPLREDEQRALELLTPT